MFEGKDVLVLLANAGTGKGNWVECRIPTPKGIKRFGDLKEGDFVFDRYGKPTKVLKVYKRGFLDAYKVTLSDGRSTIVSGDHLWTVYRTPYSNRKYTLELSEIIKEGVRAEDKRENRKLGRPKFYIPCQGIQEYTEKALPVNPYVFGAFTGNGCLTETGLTFSSNDYETVHKLELLLGEHVTAVRRSVKNYSWDFFDRVTRMKTSDFFESLYSHEKYIPSCYKYNSVENRFALLQGLFDTDGSVTITGKRLHVTYSTVSKRLAEDIKEVLSSVGIVSTIAEDKRTGKRTCYNLIVNTTKENKCKLFSLTRKKERCLLSVENKRIYNRVAIRSIEKMSEKLEINCIYVDNEEHLYQCDDGIVTHNTRRLIEEVSKELETRRPEEIAFVTFTRKGAEEGLKRVCNKLRLDPEDLPYFRTLHSLTFHAMDYKASQMFGRLDQRKFNKEYGYNVNRCEVNTGKVTATKDSQYLDFYDLERSGALTSKQLVESDIEIGYYRQLVQKYEEYKSSQCLVDFFDCLIKYVREGDSLPCKVLFVDECFSPETKVRMADMTVKEIKDIKIGDFVMGTNGATKVIAMHKGTDTMYDVMTGRKQKLFTCNSKHLILQKSKDNTVHNWKHCEDIKSRAEVFTSKCTADKTTDIKIDPYKNKLPCRVVKKGEGEYIGITVDAEDNLFLLANGCVVHNCQDITALQWQVIDKAFSKAEKIMLAGDENQSIYSYSGARPDFLIKFAKQFPVEHLSVSYRIPQSVYRLAKGIVDFIGEKTNKPFNPRIENEEGSVVQLNNMERLGAFIDEPENNADKTAWYILARNNCFLDRAFKELEDNLIPYWTADGFFMGGEIMKRLTDYEGFKLEGYKDEVKKEKFQRKFGIEDFSEPFTETNLFTEGRKWIYASYIEKYGLDKLKEMCKWNPQILVSTIHHVKGGEADNVAIMLDTTRKTKGNVFNDIDEELRILYVGVTRAKKNLFLIDSQNGEGYDNILQIIKNENKLEW